MDAEGDILQTMHYYPSGLAMPGLCKGQTTQPYQLGGKEMDPMHGLNWNDFGARRYDPAIGIWTSPHPLAYKYPWLSPRAYCAGNPVNIYDPDGKDTVVLNYTKGQHLAMLIQDENGKWQYYSVNGDNMGVPLINYHFGGRRFNDIAVGSWDTPEFFFKSSCNVEDDDSKDDPYKNSFGYSEGFLIHTTPEQDKIMRNSFKKTATTIEGLLILSLFIQFICYICIWKLYGY